MGYNYYRLFLAGCLWLLYFYVPDQQFIGKQSPDIFERVISAYLAMNVVLAFIPPRWFKEIVSSSIPAFFILCGDIGFFGLQMYSSGGVNGILGNFLIVPVAFSGVLVGSRYSSACAALGFIVCYYAEFNLHVRELGIYSGTDGFFQAGLLGIALFVISGLFQYLSRQLHRRNEEILTLDRFNQIEYLAHQTQSQLDASNERFKVLLQSAGEGLLGVEFDGTISFANRRAGLLLECNANALVGRNISGYLLELDQSELDTSELTQSPPVQKLLKAITLPDQEKIYDPHRWRTEANVAFHVEYSCESIHTESGDNAGAVIVFQDITKRKEDEERISRMANFDSLTDLVNRAHFQQALRREIGRAERLGTHLSVMYIDMDRFKYINDTLGHAGGDEILQIVASRLISSVRSGDVVARLGGDEFCYYFD
ncbi:diguanylate cyclase [Halieaceae bacterium]|nr:diguanylate cyclase [Halieaceae bacterium]